MTAQTTFRPASDKQLAFIATLMKDRVVDPEEALIANEMIDGGDFSLTMASKMIEALLKHPYKPREATVSDPVTDGMYRNPDTGEIFKVQYNRASGDGRRLYAKRLILAGDDHDGAVDYTVTFEYASGAMRQIKTAWLMTLEDAKEFGALYGQCVRCGRLLTNEDSIEKSIGPVCRRYFAAESKG